MAGSTDHYTAIPSLTRPVDEHDHVLGPESAQVTLVEYGDYQCEFTRGAHRPLTEALHKMGDSVRLAFRHFPLSVKHRHAQMAAEVAEAAAAQGKFWEMHRFLFEMQEDFDPEAIAEFAEEIGIDMDRFERETEQHAYAARVHEDIESGIASGVGETPTFFINGIPYTGPAEHEPLFVSLMAAASDEESRR